MTGPDSDTAETKQISVAELLARNGTIGAPALTRRRRRRRGDDSVTVAELTGEIPIIRDHRPEPGPVQPASPPVEPVVGPAANVAAQPRATTVYWAEPEPRWPKSQPIATRRTGPERSEYPLPMRHLPGVGNPDEQQAGAEGMRPDPVGHYTDASLDVMDSEVREAESAVQDSAYPRSYPHEPHDDAEHTLFGGQSIADEVARRRGEHLALGEDDLDADGQAQPRRPGGILAALGRAALTVLQSILAVAFGAGLFIAFDQLWRWNSIVALVLSVLVILGLVVGVRVVRKTEDIASTLIAVAVGALITLGPMALLQAG